jgi:N-acetylglucosaminyldiphosphoundecaprenol N-acetyl-beta-D-mannosaminyltransferase
MIQILDIPIYDGRLRDAVATVSKECLEPCPETPKCVSATGAHGMVEAVSNPDISRLLRGFALNLPDGMPLVWLARLKGSREAERCYGPDFFRDVMLATASMPVRHFFCGGDTGVADALKRAVEEKFGNRNCVGTFSPPFRVMTEAEWAELAALIGETRPHVVWIGLSTPKQEMFAQELARRVRAHFIITVGAAFDFHTGRLRQAPRLVQRLGLEWLFRLWVEPRRLWRRYVRVVPLFVFYSVLDLFHLNSPASKN